MNYWAAAVAIAVLASNFPPARADQRELTGAVQLAVGTSAACATTPAGGLKCWGQGYVGDGSTGRSIAGDVQGLSSGVVAFGLSKGDSHTQGHICAVLASGGVKCWGNNSHGQLGDGTTTTRSTPVEVISLPGPAVTVALGQSHTCALLASGAVHCWGDNSSGQLGGNALTSGIADIASGAQHSCALTSDGAVKCWGRNDYGQLGDGTTTNRSAPVDVQSLNSGVTRVTIGGGVSPGGSNTCAVTASGGAKCWGGITLGDSPGPHLTPFDVPELTSGVADISSGGIQTCWGSRCLQWAALTLTCVTTPGGGVKCWGVSWFGSLGNGQAGGSPFYGPTYSNFPTDVIGLSNGASSVAAGGLFGCALVAGGAVRCWGKGYEANGAGYPQPVMEGTLPQYILFGWYGPIPVGGTLAIQATGGPSGNPVLLSSQTPSICSVSGNQVTGLAQGFCVVAANQAGNSNYDPAPEVTIRFRVGDPLAQTITFGPPPDVVVNGVGTLSAMASSSLPVSFASNTPGICSVSGPIVTGLAQGSCTVAASQAGDDNYAPAPQTTQTFPVGPNMGTSGLRLTIGGSGVGTVTSSPAGISCTTTCGGNFPTGSAVTLTAATGADSYFDRWAGACSGTAPTCTVSLTSAQDISVYFQSSIPRLANISTRTRVLTGADVMIAGFIIQGNAPKTVVVRARGPSLTQSGVPGVLGNPYLQLFSGATEIANNDNHASSAYAAQVAASGFAPSDPLEAAILKRLDPGAYTAIVSGAGGGSTGVALVEIFEVDAVTVPLVNISTRGRVETGDDVMIAGFIIQGTGPQTVVLRARGPSLTASGVPNVLANPTLSLYSGQTVIASNDDWEAASNAGTIQASGFAPLDSKESAIYVTLNPGAYTAIVSGVGGTSGVGIVEVFRVP